MGSNLGRLLRYARGQENEQTENFTTEALAAAVREDPTPLLAALQRLYEARGDQEAQALLTTLAAHPRLHVATQVTLDNRRRIDFRAISKDPPLQIWIEVKVHSGQSGKSQLPEYLEEAEKHAPSRVVLLGREDLRPDLPDLAFLSWQALYDAVTPELAQRSTWWRELRHFLRELHMADSYETPVTEEELNAFAHWRTYFGKVHRILQPLARYLEKQQPSSDWPNKDGELNRQLNDQLLRWNFLVMFDKNRKDWGHLKVGVFNRRVDDGPVEPWLGMWIWIKEGAKQREAIHAACAALPAQWLRSNGNQICTVGRPLREFTTDHHQDAIDFLKARVDELKRADILDQLSR